MKRLIRLAAALYPGRWRERYGREFDALLEDLDPGWPDFWNVVCGGLAMRLTSIGAIPVGLAIGGVLAGAALSVVRPHLYRSSATVTLNASDPLIVRRMLKDTFGPEAHPSQGAERAARIRVAVDQRWPAPRDGATRLVVVTEDGDAARAQRVAQHLVNLVEQTAAAQSASNAPMRIETLGAPTLGTSPVGPTLTALAASGGAAGLLLGAVVTWFRQRSTRKKA